MTLATLVLFLALGLDTLAVALGLGLGGLPRSRWVRVGLVFALFEGGMPVVGLLIGGSLSTMLGDVAGIAAGLILIGLGGLSIREALGEADDAADEAAARVARALDRRLLLTGLTVSLDELAVGFSLGVLRVPLGPALGYIALQAFALTALGLALGSRLGARLGPRAELASGAVLALLGLALLAGKLFGFDL
ncbi:MAG: manganese efflux pump MntP family protein [Chloroflexota bacterium]|nr:manganese efflux pump MntP family protein [Chloroflexota bacterium]